MIVQRYSYLCNMKRLIILLIYMSYITLSAFSQPQEDKVKFHALYSRIDQEIEKWPQYVQARKTKIQHATQDLAHAHVIKQKFKICNDIVELYKDFQNDSALVYATMLNDIANKSKNKNLISISNIKLAFQAIKAGHNDAARDYLAIVDTTIIDKNTLIDYYKTQERLYGELAAYCYIWSKREEYIKHQALYRNLILNTIPKNSAEWLQYMAYEMLMQNRFQDAEHYSNLCLKKAIKFSSVYIKATFDRRFICENLNQPRLSCYYLALSSIGEIKQGITDQVGLWSLASKMEKAELNRSHRYLQFSWTAINMFGKSMKSWQITPVMSTIEQNYKRELAKYNNLLQLGIISLCILLFALFAILSIVNVQRKELNKYNNKLLQTNEKLSDASKAKEEYIVRLLMYNSDFIDRKEEERRKESKLFRSGKEKELLKLLNSADKTNKELNQLLDHFDEIFLSLYPNFINDFNQLLQEDKRIYPTSSTHKMNTPLRIFALMRLGIEKVPDVANILHCSPQTIYNYRNNLRNSSRFERNSFEERVKKIGMPNLVNDI